MFAIKTTFGFVRGYSEMSQTVLLSGNSADARLFDTESRAQMWMKNPGNRGIELTLPAEIVDVRLAA